jgi:hypothetical protein
MSNPADIDRVRQDLVHVPSAEQAAPDRAATAINADWKPKVLSVELLFEAHHASGVRQQRQNTRAETLFVACFRGQFMDFATRSSG